VAFSQKLISLTVQLADNPGTNQPNKFTGTDSSQVTLKNHRTSVRVINQGASYGSTAQVKVWGLAPELMIELATLGLNYNIVPHNILTIQAGDASGLATVFSGTIWACYGDFQAQPDVPTIFECTAGGFEATAPAAMTSTSGPTPVAQVIETIAGQLKYGFENNGVDVVLQSAGGGGVALQGSLLEQARQAADHAHIHLGIVNGSSGLTLAIWPWDGSRNTASPPTISPQTGMISYPIFTPNGIQFETLFDPTIQFGGKVKVNSSLLNQILGAQKAQIPALNVPPDSTWAVNQINLALDSMLPRGQWSSTVTCWNPSQARPVTTP
jgi:hypothetical protein